MPLKNVAILLADVIINGAKFYLKLLLEEALLSKKSGKLCNMLVKIDETY